MNRQQYRPLADILEYIGSVREIGVLPFSHLQAQATSIRPESSRQWFPEPLSAPGSIERICSITSTGDLSASTVSRVGSL